MTLPSRSWTLLLGLLCVTAVVRGGVLWALRENLQQDPDAYREIAENLIRHGEFALDGRHRLERIYRPTAYRPPLYPVVLSNLATVEGQSLSLLKVAGLHLLLGLGAVGLTSLAAWQFLCIGPPGLSTESCGVVPSSTLRSGLLSGGPSDLRWPPLAAGLLVAFDPILLNQQTLVMTESLAAFLAILSLWCLTRFDATRGWFEAGLSGGAIGLAILCRPTFLPWLMLVTLACLGYAVWDLGFAKQRHDQERRRWSGFWRQVINGLALIALAAVFVAPWTIRNYRLFGKRIATTTHGGYTFLLGNNESFYQWLRSETSGVPWSADSYFTDAAGVLSNLNMVIGTHRFPTAHVNEVNLDRQCYEIARKAIADHPGDFIRACLYRIGQLWSPLPHKLSEDESSARRLMRYATCGWYVGVYLLAAVGIWRLKGRLLRPPWIWGVLLCLAFMAVHTFYWTNLRMRAPLMPFVAIVAAAGAEGLFGALNLRSSQTKLPRRVTSGV